ncbi:substrate-binding periplasmic protein [Colwellia psychrerythraea]|uniref:ABC-type transporter, periplasmic subunit family 3 n=1 Tax=Colwellia psychrerythraea TaxID=28229 RepID=A0A099KQ03_COLPS|nr:ABC transporter substrate-binding protein [Colwellia psychrerythraea]KGJ91987.1 ABC-type transporter, periplasmic subunit family 3 [Colwellia psychrerythraea]
MCSKASSQEIVMAFSQEIPPYIIEATNSGIEIDIISAALAYKGHTLKPLYFPLGRVPIAFSNHLVDAAMGDMGIQLEDGFYADPAVIYDNIFITLKSRNITINRPSDLDSLYVASFQSAEKRYPDWLNNVVKENRFFGVSDQLTQVKLLQLGRYDVVLCDRYIFKYFVNKIELQTELEFSDVDEHNFITVDPMNYRPVFRSEKIRDDFNLGLKYLKESGEFQKIYDQYLES